MLTITKSDADRLVEIMEYLLKNEFTVSVEQMCRDCDITFEEYRLVCRLYMPAERYKNECERLKMAVAVYKGKYHQMKYMAQRMEETLNRVREICYNGQDMEQAHKSSDPDEGPMEQERGAEDGNGTHIA